MRKLRTLAGAALIACSAGAFANEGIYHGPSVTHYVLDKERFISDESQDSTAVGLHLGYNVAEKIAFELGFNGGVGGEEIDAWSLSGLYFMDTLDDDWKPFLKASFATFDFDDSQSLADSDDQTEQLGFGFGLMKSFSDQWEVRGGLTAYVFGGEDSATDMAFDLGLNYYIDKPAPAPVVEEPAPEPEPVVPQTRTITVQLKVLFEFDKAKVQAIYGDELLAVANAMKEHNDIELLLEGHTDAIGTDAYNQDLSLRRVQAVKAKLVEVYGIPSGRVSTVGYGESRPIADNSTDAGRAQNRRVIGQVTFEEVVND